MLEVPVVLLVFNRPTYTQKMFETVRKARPTTLYIVADGPRNETEREVCEQVRAIVEQVDWDCEVHHNYAEHNMGLKARISSGLNWVFEQVEMAIILEDDCIPHPDFFRFCETLLDRYRDDEQVMHISGDNFGYTPSEQVSYYFSHYAHVWGWATWRRAWQRYDLQMTYWDDPDQRARILSRFQTDQIRNYWENILEATYKTKIQTWDFQWAACCLLHNGLCAMPRTNLVTNIGAGAGATNTHAESAFTGRALQALDFPLRHPNKLEHDLQGDQHTDRLFLGAGKPKANFVLRVMNAVKRRLKRWV